MIPCVRIRGSQRRVRPEDAAAFLAQFPGTPLEELLDANLDAELLQAIRLSHKFYSEAIHAPATVQGSLGSATDEYLTSGLVTGSLPADTLSVYLHGRYWGHVYIQVCII